MTQMADAEPREAGAAALAGGGVLPPLITPLRPDRTVDTESLVSLARALEAGGVAGFLALGSTGEGPHLGPDAAEAVTGTLAEACGVPVVVNVAAISTGAAADAARRAKAAGADLILAPPPSGFPLSQSELARHYAAVAEAAGEAVMAYHVPVRVPTAVSPALVARLMADGVLAGVKDSSGDLDNHRRTAKLLQGRGVLFTGSETCIDLAIQAGFLGAVPGLSNVYPRTEVALVAAARAGDWPAARALQEQIVDCMELYFAPGGDASFSAVALGALKVALVEAGVIETATLTAPFTEPGPELVDHVVAHLGRHPAELCAGAQKRG